MGLITKKHILLTLCYCHTIHTVISDTNRQDMQTIQGLLNSILSSSAQGEASINIDRSSVENSGVQPANRDRINARSAFNDALNDTRQLTSSTTTPLPDYDYDDSMEVPEPVLLARSQTRIKSRVITEREDEKSHVEAKETRKAQIKSFLLKKLRLDHLPTPRMADFYTRFPHHILYGTDNDGMQMDEPEREDNYHAKIQEMIRFPQQVPEEKRIKIESTKLSSTMYFPMPLSLTEESIDKATLMVYLITPAGYENEEVTLKILTNKWSKWIATKRVVLGRGGHWQHIDITDECRGWLQQEWRNNFGVVAEAEIKGINLVDFNISHIASNTSIPRLPLVKLELNEMEYNRRNKRSVNSDMPLACHPDDNERGCCRYPFVIDFDELGPEFRFIISPKRYRANYCKGICPEYVLPYNANIQLTRGVHKSQRCCSPSTVESLTLIYLNDNSDIMKGVIPGMSITGCGCE